MNQRKKIKRAAIIFQLILQVALLFPWMKIGAHSYNAIMYLAKISSSSESWMAAVRNSLSGIVDFAVLDSQSADQLIIIFSFEVLMALLVQIISIINLIITFLKKHLPFLDVIALLGGCAMAFTLVNGTVFTNLLSVLYPFVILVILLVSFLGVKIIEALPESNQKYKEAKETEQIVRKEKKDRMAFQGKYSALFYQVLRKNFFAGKKDFLILFCAGIFAMSLLFAGIGSAEILSPLSRSVNILRRNGIGAILVSYILISFVISIFLIAANLLFYLRKRMKNYGIFVNIGMRKRTMYQIIGVEILSNFLLAVLGSCVLGNFLLAVIRSVLRSRLDIETQLGNVSFITYLAVFLLTFCIYGVSILILHDFYLNTEMIKSRFRIEEAEKMPGRFRKVLFFVGIALSLFAVFQYTRRENAEGVIIILMLFLGMYLAMKNGIADRFIHRKSKQEVSYYTKLIHNNFWYHRYKSTFRYIFSFGAIPIIVLFLFSKEMISAQIAQEPKELFPYDYMCMATEEDTPFFEELGQEYGVHMNSFPMVRVTNVDNTEMLEDYRSVMLPQGQHIGISESTYAQLCEAVGKPVKPLKLSSDGSDVYIIYQQDKSVKAHPIDYLFSRKEPYLHIGQPIEAYGYLFREEIFPKRKVSGEKIDILTGAYRRGDYENIIVFSDEYFASIQDDWKTTNWIDGSVIEEEGIEGVTIHHWPTNLVLMKLSDGSTAVHNAVEKELQKFAEKHALDEKFDSEVLAFYSSETEIKEIKAERLLTVILNLFLICTLLYTSFFILYLKVESEMKEKKKRNEFLRCMGMCRKERALLIKHEFAPYVWIPILMTLVVAPVLTGIIWILREYTAEDCICYVKWLGVLGIAYLILHVTVIKFFEVYTIRKVEK